MIVCNFYIKVRISLKFSKLKLYFDKTNQIQAEQSSEKDLTVSQAGPAFFLLSTPSGALGLY